LLTWSGFPISLPPT